MKQHTHTCMKDTFWVDAYGTFRGEWVGFYAERCAAHAHRRSKWCNCLRWDTCTAKILMELVHNTTTAKNCDAKNLSQVSAPEVSLRSVIRKNEWQYHPHLSDLNTETKWTQHLCHDLHPLWITWPVTSSPRAWLTDRNSISLPSLLF